MTISTTNDTQLNQPESIYLSIAIQPTPPQQEPTFTVENVGTGTSQWLPRCLDQLLPVLTDGLLTLCRRRLDVDPAELYEEQLADFLQENGITAFHGAYAQMLATYTLRYHRPSSEQLPDAEQEKKRETEKLLTNFGTGKAVVHSFCRPDRADFLLGPISTLLLLEEVCDQWTRPHLVFDLDDEEWLDSDRPKQRQKTLRYLGNFAPFCRLTICCSPEVERRIRLLHKEWIDSVTQYSTTPLIGVPSCNDFDTHHLREGYRQLVTMESRPGKLRLLAVLHRCEAATLTQLQEAVEERYTDYSEGTIRRYASELADEHGLVQKERDGRQKFYSLSERGRQASALIKEDDGFRILHPLELERTTGCNSAACTVYGTDRNTKGLQSNCMYSVESRSSEGKEDE